jgi:hypothetical protein
MSESSNHELALRRIDFPTLSLFKLHLSNQSDQKSSTASLDWSVMSGWRSVPARRLLSRVSPVNAVIDFSRVTSHSFTPRATHTLAKVRQQQQQQQHDIILYWKTQDIRTHTGDPARARRKFTTSSIQKHGHIDPPKPGEESVFHLPAG